MYRVLTSLNQITYFLPQKLSYVHHCLNKYIDPEWSQSTVFMDSNQRFGVT